MDKFCCETCYFFQRAGRGLGYGECRARSPQQGPNGWAEWPRVGLDYWCGDHSTDARVPEGG